MVVKSVQASLFGGRRIAWFSCGVASAVNAKLACEVHPKTIIAHCNSLAEEHKDNLRFLNDVQRWIGKRIMTLNSLDYTSPTEVFEKTRYMAGPDGARCTTELKKIPRTNFQFADDIHMFGFTANEAGRIRDFESRNPELLLEWPLRDKGITKQDCYRIISDAGIRLPEMYMMGYPHNNCKCCVKATSPGYWNKCRKDFPELFASRLEQSRRLGVRLVKYKGEHIFLDELPPEAKGRWKDEVISCGPECGKAQP